MKKYVELYNTIRREIEQHQLKPGDKIPSIRKASEIYNVSITTIQNAYFDLCTDGYIASIDKSGYFVTDIAAKKVDTNENTADTEVLYDLTGGIADEECFDLSLWQRYIKSALRQKNRLLSYSSAQGESDLREAISKYIYEKRNVVTSADRIIVAAGVQPLLQILCSLIDKKQSVSFPDSSFTQGIKVFRDYGFDVHTRDKDANIIYVSPSHMTSWGNVMPTKRRLELVSYSQKNNSLVIEDDYENEFLYNSKPTPSLYALGKDNVIYIGSFSAMLLPAIRISFMVLTKELTETFKSNEEKYAQTASLTEQIALCNYIRDGHIYSQTRKIRRLYTAKTKLFYNKLKNAMPHINARISENSLQVIVNTDKPYSETEFEEHGIKIYMPSEKTIVFSPVGIKTEKFDELINIMNVNIFLK